MALYLWFIASDYQCFLWHYWSWFYHEVDSKPLCCRAITVPSWSSAGVDGCLAYSITFPEPLWQLLGRETMQETILFIAFWHLVKASLTVHFYFCTVSKPCKNCNFICCCFFRHGQGTSNWYWSGYNVLVCWGFPAWKGWNHCQWSGQPYHSELCCFHRLWATHRWRCQEPGIFRIGLSVMLCTYT